MLVSSINFTAVLQRLRMIVQYTAIALTYKIKATGSRQAGEVMVLELFVFCVLRWLCVIAFIMTYCMVAQTWRASQACPM
jgi:hypothetical protein